MLNRSTLNASGLSPSAGAFVNGPVDVGFREIFAFVARNMWRICVGLVIGFAVGVAYLLLTPPTFTAQTSLLIDSRKLSIFDAGNVFEDSSLTTGTVESQLQILQSGELAEAAIEKLPAQVIDRLDSSTSAGVGALIRDMFRSLLPKFGDVSEIDATRLSPEQLAKMRVADAIRLGLSVSRVDLSYVLDVSYSAPTPQMASQIVDAVAAAYVEGQLNEQFTTAERATKWLEARLDELRRQASDETLSVRERNAVRETYNTFLQRYTETSQQQSLPFTEARVITAARLGEKTWPKNALVVVGALALGAFLGIGYALSREIFDGTIKSCEQAEQVLRVNCLGALPMLSRRSSPLRDANNRSKKRHRDSDRTATDKRCAQFGEVFLFAADSIERSYSSTVPVLGIVSANRHEGRSTVALCLAQSLATSGSRVLLVDADFYDLGLTRSMGLDEGDGLAQTLIEGRDPMACVTSDPNTQFDFVGGGTKGCTKRGGEVFRMPAFASFLRSARQTYNFVVLDLPAILSSPTAQIAASRCDGLLFVVEAGSTAEHDALAALAKTEIHDRVFGQLLNKSS